MDENGHYPPEIASLLMGADKVELSRLAQVGKMVIEHSQYVRAWEWLTDMFLESDTGREATSGLFYGVPGAGKTTILRRFAKKFGGPFPTRDGAIRPVIRVSTPANPNLVNLLQAILIALEAEGLINNDAADMRLSVLRQLTAQQVRMIIFDEFTHIVEDRSEKFAAKTMRGLKELLSEKHCQVVFAGTEDLIKIHKLYGQMRRRSVGDMQLTAFSWESDDDQAEWMAMMDLIQGHLLLKVSPPLGTDAIGRKMNQASGGIMDNVMKLLFRATSFAHRDGGKTISMGHLSMAFERLRRGDMESVNPFGKPMLRRPKPRLAETHDEETNLSKRKNKRDRDDGFEAS